MHAWLAALCGMAGGGALAALPLFLARADHFVPLSADSENQKNRMAPDHPSTVTQDEVMARLPAAPSGPNDPRLPCVMLPDA